MKTELSTYMAGVCRHKILTRQEEHALAIKAKAGDSKARETIIVSNLRFVVQVANKYKTYTNSGRYSILDLIQEGNGGLVHAFNKFDPSSGYRFTTYAVHWIKARIMNFIIRMHSVVKIGTTASERKLFFKMGKIRELSEIKDPENKDTAVSNLAEELNTTEVHIKKMENRIYWKDSSMDKPIGPDTSPDDNGGYSLKDTIPSTDIEEVIDEHDFQLKAKLAIASAMKGLTDREKDIISMRYLSQDGSTLQKIADKYGLSRERIRQIQSKTLERMREKLERNKVGREIIDQIK